MMLSRRWFARGRLNTSWPASRSRRRVVAAIGSAAVFVAAIGPVAALDSSPQSSLSVAAASLYAAPTDGPGWTVRSLPVAEGLSDVAGLTFDAVSGDLVVTGTVGSGGL